MRIKNSHLTLEERCIIYGLKSTNTSIRNIAQELGVNASTVSRELKRNSKQGGYKPEPANNRYRRRRKKSVRYNAITPEIRGKIIYGLSQYFSPEQISGMLKLEGINISYDSIYRFIWNDKSYGGELYLYLRRSGKRYNKKKRSSWKV